MPGVDDDQLLRLMRQVEEQEMVVDDALDAPNPEPAHDACPACGEPAEALDACVYCAEPGCLPPELWSPGMPDNCLTRCARCARHLHVACGVEDQAGNPVCPRCP